MLEILILYIQATFKNSFPAIQDVHGLAEQVRNGNKTFPSLYCTNDEYQPLSGNENFLYFRQLGAATEAESDEESVSGCDRYVTRTYPMVTIAYIPKNVFNTDNAFIDSKVSGNIANILRIANYGSLMASMKVEDIHAEVNRISTDRYEVWDQEFKGIDMAARFDHVLCAVEFDLIVSATERCLQNYDCNDETVTVEGDTIVVEISDSNAWHKDGDFLTEIKKLGSTNDVNWQITHNNVTIATIQADGVNLNVLNARATAGTIFLTTENGVIKSRTAPQVRSDIGAGTGSVTSVGLLAGTSGTDVNITGSPVTGAGSITINIPDASATNRGLVTTGSQVFAGQKIFNGNVGFGGKTPTLPLDVNGIGYATEFDSPLFKLIVPLNGQSAYNFYEGTTRKALITWFSANAPFQAERRNTLEIAPTIANADVTFRPNDVEVLRIKSSTQRVGIGTITPAQKLDVFGVSRGLAFQNGVDAAVNQLIADGDSLTATPGFGGATPWLNVVTTTLTFTKSNVAVAGRNIVEMIDAASVNVDSKLNFKTIYNICVIWGGVNNIDEGQSVTNTYSQIAAYCAQRRRNGLRVVVCTMISCIGSNGGGTYDSQLQALSTLIRNNWQLFADGLADLQANASLGATGAYTDTTYFNADGIHLNSTGQALAASIIGPAIDLVAV